MHDFVGSLGGHFQAAVSSVDCFRPQEEEHLKLVAGMLESVSFFCQDLHA